MEPVLIIGLVLAAAALILREGTRPPLEPPIIYIQAQPTPPPSMGCLPILLLVVLGIIVAALLSL
jgi:hypothetical protein